MSVTAVVGANWGDEGKGRFVDYLAQYSDIVIRFQGGDNAGHTVINMHGKFKLHLIPSGIFYPKVVNILGPGVALNPEAFISELSNLKSSKIKTQNIMISDRAQIVLPYHLLFDQYEEERLRAKKFGSTKRGIAPFYGDKYLKIGIQVSDFLDKKRFAKRLRHVLSIKNLILKSLYKRKPLIFDNLYTWGTDYARKIKPFVCDTFPVIHKALNSGKRILLEGQLGALRDPDHGIYPFSTSSSTLAGFASVGAGIPPYKIKRIIAVVKAYSTCVGAGPFVTELSGKLETLLRETGQEYGAQTGRPRRVGWFDAVATRYGCKVQGATEVALTKLDVLSVLRSISICTAYSINGKKTKDFLTNNILEKARPILEKVKGWQSDISKVRKFEGLPNQARRYVEKTERLIGLPVKWISVGPERNALRRRISFC